MDDKMRQAVVRAFTTVETIGTVLEGAADCAARAKALRAWRTENADELAQITKELHQYPLAELKPVILAERANYPRASVAPRIAMECSGDADFAAEWGQVSGLLGGAG